MVILIFIMMLQQNLFAQDKVILSDLIKIAKERNPDIIAMQQAVLAAKENIIATRFWDFPSVGIEYWFAKEKSLMGSISQMFPFPGKISSRVKIAKSDADIAQELLSLKTISVISEVKKTFYMYYLVHRNIEIVTENIDLMKQFAANSSALYITGKVPQSDVLKANTEIARMENMLLMHEAEKKSAGAMLAALLNYTNDKQFGVPELKENNLQYLDFTNFIVSKFPEVRIKKFSAKKPPME